MSAPTPTGLRFGAVLGGFDVEGGFNGPGQPANNWCWWEVEGRAPVRGAPGGFWNNWEAEVERVAAAGCDSACVSIEWARCEPLDGRLDRRAIAAYCRLLDCCHQNGLQPAVTLHRFAHPAWMGVEFWLLPDSPERFRNWVETALDHFAGRTHQWVTIDQLNVSALRAYLVGSNPPGRRRDVAATIRSLDHLLAAHVLAYEAIKERQPQAVVSTGNRSLPVYELDRLLVDLLLGRRTGVGRHELGSWLAERRQQFHHTDGAATGGRPMTRVLRHLAKSSIPLEQALARAVAAVYESSREQSIDVLRVSSEGDGTDHVLPALVSGAEPDEPPLAAACRAYADVGLPLSVLSDTAASAEALRQNRLAVERACAQGADVTVFYQRLAPAPPRRPGVPEVRVVPRLRRRAVTAPT